MRILNKLKKIFNNHTAVCYYRCSKRNKREYIRQEYICKHYAEKNGFNIVNEFGEIISGNATFDERTQLIDCITYCIKNKCSTILISESDRLSRNNDTLNAALEFIKSFKIKFIICDENINTGRGKRDIDKLILNVKAAHYELKCIKHRLDSGRKRYVDSGGKVGRKVGYTKTKDMKRSEYAKVLDMLFNDCDKYSIRKIAKLNGISASTVQRLKAEFKDEYQKYKL